MLSLTLENYRIQWAASFPQASLPQSPPPPNSISNRGLGLIHLVKKSKPAVGTQTKLELFFEACLAYLGGHCHYVAGFAALLLGAAQLLLQMWQRK